MYIQYQHNKLTHAVSFPLYRHMHGSVAQIDSRLTPFPAFFASLDSGLSGVQSQRCGRGVIKSSCTWALRQESDVVKRSALFDVDFVSLSRKLPNGTLIHSISSFNDDDVLAASLAAPGGGLGTDLSRAASLSDAPSSDLDAVKKSTGGGGHCRLHLCSSGFVVRPDLRAPPGTVEVWMSLNMKFSAKMPSWTVMELESRRLDMFRRAKELLDEEVEANAVFLAALV